MSHRSYSALALLAAVGLASSLAACSKEEEKKAAWSCHAADVPQGEVVRCTSAALAIDSDGYYGGETTGETTGGAGSETAAPPVESDSTSSSTIGAGSGYGVGSFSPGGTSLTSDATSATGVITYECFPGDTSPDCPPIDASLDSDGTNSTGEVTGGAGSNDGNAVGTDSTSSKGNGNGNGGGAGSANKYTGPDECAYVPDLPYCANGSSDETGNNGNGNGNGSGSGNGNGNGNGGANGKGPKSEGSPSGTTDGTSSSGGKHFKCVKDDKGNKSCESVPDCPTGSTPSNGACVDSSTPGSSEVLRPENGGCWVTGGGFIVSKNDLTGAPADGHDNYGGNAKPMKDGRIQGHWNHVDHGTGNHAKGRPEYIVCRKIDGEPGPGQPGCKKGHCMNQVYFGGHAEWRDHAKGVWESGYWFDVVAKDHGEPGSQPHAKNEGFVDTYHFTIRKLDDTAAQASGTVVYEVGRDSVKGGDGLLVGGNIQIHPPNNGHPYTANTLPSWVTYENPPQ